MKYFFIAILGLSSSVSFADNLTKEVSCGDHWFSISIDLSTDQAIATLSGDSIGGEDLAYNTLVTVSAVASSMIYNFTFGDNDQPDQSLTVYFQNQDTDGVGVYKANADGVDQNMNCARK